MRLTALPVLSAATLAGMTLLSVLSPVARTAPASRAALDRLAATPTDRLLQDPASTEAAMQLGQQVFTAHCASCHGADLKGVTGLHVPDLTDDKWLFTGEDLDEFVMHPSDVEQTIRHGIRDPQDPETRNLAVMPGRGQGGTLTEAQIEDVADYVLQLAGRPHDAARAARGASVYAGPGGCYDCHDPEGVGDGAIGATDLTRPDAWLYGSDRAALLDTLHKGRAGMSPAFQGKLTDAEIKATAVYVFKAAASDKF